MPPSPLPPHRPPSRWPRPRFVHASVGVHAAAGAAAVVVPGAEAWALSAVALNHAVLTGAGLWPRSGLLGPNLHRLPATEAHRKAVALTLDDGPDPAITPRVLDLLDAAGARATFFCIAERARRHPALVRRMVERGHSVQNHSATHRHHFSLLGPAGFEREVGHAQALLADLTGTRPHCFRAPAGLRNPLLDPVLHRLNLHLVSWTRRGFDTRDGDATRVLGRLTRDLAGGDILLLHDGHGRSSGGRTVVLDVLPRLLQRCQAAGLHLVTLTEAVPLRHATEGGGA
ncbi:MAG: polysaccharide deacetylase family protein [Rubrivivax sp.]|nr:polysaccharide deacetylase family protein [Rubrivivax sp.]